MYVRDMYFKYRKGYKRMSDTRRDVYLGSTVVHNLAPSQRPSSTSGYGNYGTFTKADACSPARLSLDYVTRQPVGYQPDTNRWYPQAQSPNSNCCQDIMNLGFNPNTAFNNSVNPHHHQHHPFLFDDCNYIHRGNNTLLDHLYNNQGQFLTNQVQRGMNNGVGNSGVSMVTQYNTPYQYYIQQYIIQSNDTLQSLVIPNPLNHPGFEEDTDGTTSSASANSLEMSQIRSRLASASRCPPQSCPTPGRLLSQSPANFTKPGFSKLSFNSSGRTRKHCQRKASKDINVIVGYCKDGSTSPQPASHGEQQREEENNSGVYESFKIKSEDVATTAGGVAVMILDAGSDKPTLELSTAGNYSVINSPESPLASFIGISDDDIPKTNISVITSTTSQSCQTDLSPVPQTPLSSCLPASIPATSCPTLSTSSLTPSPELPSSRDILSPATSADSQHSPNTPQSIGFEWCSQYEYELVNDSDLTPAEDKLSFELDSPDYDQCR